MTAKTQTRKSPKNYLFFVITTGSKHYALYQCYGIKIRKHVSSLDIKNYSNRMQAKKEFKKLILALHGNDNFSIEFKG